MRSLADRTNADFFHQDDQTRVNLQNAGHGLQ